MDSKKKKFILTIPTDIEADAAEVKRDLFHDKSYAEMYHQLILIGIEKLKKNKKMTSEVQTND